MPRPINLIDAVHDFGADGTIPYYITISSSTFITYFNGMRKAGIAHLVSKGNSSLAKLQNSAGQDSPPATSETVTEALQGNNNFAPLSLTVKELTVTESKTFLCRIDSPNRWQSDFRIYYNPFYFGEYYIKLTDASHPTYEYYYYKIFQKSVAIIEDITTIPTVVNAQTKSIPINTLVRISKAKSRGDEVVSSWLIQVKDSNGNFGSAIQGTDYSINFGSLGSDIVEVKLLQPKVFRIIAKTAGFTSNNNTFPDSGTGSVSVNEDSTFYLLDVQGSNVNTQDIITLPKIKSVVTIQNQITNSPSQTGYTGSNISVGSTIDISSGAYLIKDLNTGIQTTVNLTEAQWIQELTTRADIKLEIKNKLNNSIVVSKNGLGPHLNINLPEGNYFVQFKTTLK